ncbi:TRAP transporter permease [Numidum massiliense]|uniref:TRAP transporter permease n=1 Tax=Numidum massiliense TaxID=1522315 RepID=UPI0006D59B12|nr:TRAP transporter permease [Numidum massiliense]
MADNGKTDNISEEEIQKLREQYDPEAAGDSLQGVMKWIVFTLTVAFSLFHLYAAHSGGFASEIQRSIHLGFALVLIFLVHPFAKRKKKGGQVPPWDTAVSYSLAGVGGFIGLYWVLNFSDLMSRAGAYTATDLTVAVLAIVLVLEATRRAVGIPITIIVSLFLLYALAGQYMPGFLGFSGVEIDRLASHMFFTTEGILGTPLGVSSTFIFMFLLYGAMLDKTGVGNYFNDLALVVAGRFSGGPAKVAVFSSALQGTISGSSVGNVVTTGSYTIPLMKKLGYRKEFAGAVEAAASTGGQLMPPVMGAAAFIMAEFTRIPYWDIVIAASIPAVLYFTGIIIMTHYEAKRLGLRGMTKEELPNPLDVLKRAYLLLPIVVMIYLLATGYTPMFAALYGIYTAAAIGFLQELIKHVKQDGFLKGIGGAIVATIKLFIEALASGGRTAMSVAIACGAAGMIVGVVTLTGLGLKFGTGIVTLAGGSVALALILTMVSSLLLGMGIPTTANYIITSTVAAPVLIQMGFPLLAAHMFVFYFGIVADITPPVALAAFAASGISRGDPLKTGVQSTRLAIAAFMIPYIFVFSPQMLLIDTTWSEAALVFVSSTIGMLGVGAGMIGYWQKKLHPLLRLVTIVGGVLIVVPEWKSSLGGLAILVAVWCYQRWIQKVDSDSGAPVTLSQ